ncbi:MAG: GIY-YIG nuclease family protein [Elusimicrobia bacterium]|nr:GIY-YIG nuclease family protein [Candidatus Liberimonas magnetica]
MSTCRFIKRWDEFRPQEDINKIPRNTKGIYALLKEDKGHGVYNVVYIGLSAGEKAGVLGRIRKHSKKKHKQWTHFTIFEVHENIYKDEIHELEALFRQIYSKDSRANKLNKQRRYKKFNKIRVKLKDWKLV